MKKILITMGDAAGIGPEIILKSFQQISSPEKFLLIGNKDIFDKTEKMFNIKLPNNLEFLNIDYNSGNIKTCIESKYSGELAYLCLEKACELVNNSYADKIATAPLSKNALHLAGYNYSGQTEILQHFLGDEDNKAQMLFVAEKLRVLLLTRHESILNVPKLITEDNIISTVKILNRELVEKFNIKTPKLAMCALNPHAGENGILGREEIDIINPAIKKLNNMGIDIKGSFSADTLLGKAVKNYQNSEFDGYIACYHDQALPAIKSLGLENVLNVTIGLKALRVSPSHGTAFDIAGKNLADYRSMLNSLLWLMLFSHT